MRQVKKIFSAKELKKLPLEKILVKCSKGICSNCKLDMDFCNSIFGDQPPCYLDRQTAVKLYSEAIKKGEK